ncbi:SGNH/GDSL hydrolase family protein [Leifsonia aquatica]|uniref:SGNH/GDSL hydrolase family protein n=1 Tax=Leifsonia aquatica TaxID=144185 RepID=UPI0004698740|nr:SGNH/GDSL hydrolase family protein [Leifsonia aquatica]
MLAHRPLAAFATAITVATIGAAALSGCASTVDPVALGTPVVNPHYRVAVIGDSIEAGLGLTPGEAWPDLLAVDRRWGLDNLSVSGAGFVATGADGGTFASQVDAAIADNAQLVLIGASDNDLGQDDATVTAAMTAAIGKLHTALPHARIIGYDALSGAASDDDLAPLDAALQTAVTADGGVWIDLGEPYRDQDGLVQADGEHPTAAGQQAIAAVALTDLDGLVAARSTAADAAHS